MIVDPLTLLAFIPAGLALNLTPGADMMYCLGQRVLSSSRATVWLGRAMAAIFLCLATRLVLLQRS